MSKNENADVLQILPFEKWLFLRDMLKYKWPIFAYHYYWMENSIQWRKKDPNTRIQIYCPGGNYEKGIFIGIMHHAWYGVVIFSLHHDDETIRKLQNIIDKTNVINWNISIEFAMIHGSIVSHVLPMLKNRRNLQNIEPEEVHSFNYYFKSAEECTDVKICIPEECYVRSLDKSDIPLIHSIWPHKNLERPDLSEKYLTTLLEMNDGIGLCLKKDNSLVAWVMHNDFHGLGMLQTVEEHKKKGYAKVVTNLFSKQLGEKGISVTLFIAEGNTASEKLFSSLGWKAIVPCVWVMYNKELYPKEDS